MWLLVNDSSQDKRIPSGEKVVTMYSKVRRNYEALSGCFQWFDEGHTEDIMSHI